MDNGELYSWGSNKHGIIGIGDNLANQYGPVRLTVEEEDHLYIIDINAGKSHCGLIAKKMSKDN